MFLILVSDNLMAGKCTNIFDTYIASIIHYLYYIVFDQDTLFISEDFKDWAARKGMKLELSPVFYPQKDGQPEIANKVIL